MAPICGKDRLSKTSHFVAGIACPACEVDPVSFNVYYVSLGVAVMPSVLDGDCGGSCQKEAAGVRGEDG